MGFVRDHHLHHCGHSLGIFFVTRFQFLNEFEIVFVLLWVLVPGFGLPLLLLALVLLPVVRFLVKESTSFLLFLVDRDGSAVNP